MCSGLVARLGAEVQRPLAAGWLRMMVVRDPRRPAARLPPLRAGAGAMASPTRSAGDGAAPRSRCGLRRPQRSRHAGRDRRRRGACAAAAGASRAAAAAALHLLRFDERSSSATDRPVADNVGWLDFSHALTFGHALRLQCARQPELWPQGAAADGAVRRPQHRLARRRRRGAAPALERWAVPIPPPSTPGASRRILDHGLAQYIYPVHLLKT